MKIPMGYTFRSLWTRRLTTLLTIGGVSLVVFVFAAVFMLASGLEKTLVQTGSSDNVIALRKSAQAELQSQIDRDAANILITQPEVALTPAGKPFAATELYVLINILKKGSGDMGNITVRGVTPESFLLRPYVKITAGRTFTPGSSEIIVGSNIAKNFDGTAIGDKMKFGGNLWTIVGTFDAGGTGFDSEIWGDVEQVMPAFGRPVFSSVTMRFKDPSQLDEFKARLDGDKRLNYLDVKREKDYYSEQSEQMALFLRIMGGIITFIFSFGAMIGAMITMYAAVANRTVEIGTLRALGFRRHNILFAFLVESIILSLIGAAVGLFAASFLQFFVISTLNFNTFSELAFGFNLTPMIVLSVVIVAVVMGVLGGFLPAIRAARLNIVSALRGA